MVDKNEFYMQVNVKYENRKVKKLCNRERYNVMESENIQALISKETIPRCKA